MAVFTFALKKNICRLIAARWQKIIFLLFFFCLVAGIILYKIILLKFISFSSFLVIYSLITSVYFFTRLIYAYFYEDNHELVNTHWPSVSVIIAVRNEERDIFKTIEAVVASQYQGSLECIVVDDGSTDQTFAEIKKAKNTFGSIINFIRFPENLGKREAMAVGTKLAKNDILVFVDSDTFVNPDGIAHIVYHFITDEKVGAVSGHSLVRNASVNFLTKMQAIQYAISFNIYKTGESIHGAVTCCPGCFSAYRRDALLPILYEWKNQRILGKRSTFGDDRGLTNFVLRNWKVVFCRQALAYTAVPEKLVVYFKQQLRWKKSWIREGYIASRFFWRRHPLVSFAFYTNFSFPFMAPIFGLLAVSESLIRHSPAIVFFYIFGFALTGLMFSLFLRLFGYGRYWNYIPLFSFFYAFVFVWQMPYALLTINRTHWGTR
jgi:hyaluronan synthase